MHILQGDYSELFRTHQKSLRRKQRQSEERKEDCQDKVKGSDHETEAVDDSVTRLSSTMPFILPIPTFKSAVH